LIVGQSILQAPRFVLDKGQGQVDPIGYPLWRRAGDWLSRRKYLVLTFDDGPYGDGVDEHILEILKRHRAHAIFFIVCNRLSG